MAQHCTPRARDARAGRAATGINSRDARPARAMHAPYGRNGACRMDESAACGASGVPGGPKELPMVRHSLRLVTSSYPPKRWSGDTQKGGVSTRFSLGSAGFGDARPCRMALHAARRAAHLHALPEVPGQHGEAQPGHGAGRHGGVAARPPKRKQRVLEPRPLRSLVVIHDATTRHLGSAGRGLRERR